MKDLQKYSLISGLSFTAALLFFALYNQWILFVGPMNSTIDLFSAIEIHKKEIVQYYFCGNKWKTEKQEILWNLKNDKNIFQLINAWLSLAHEERIIHKKTALQSVLLSQSGCVYLSFDHNILGKEETIFKKWMLIEGILKTLKLNDIVVQEVQFLVQHQPLQDAHLDFSFAWPAHGFMQKS